MGIRFHCEHCNRRLNVKAVQAGRAGQCPHCLKTVIVPSAKTAVASVASRPVQTQPHDSDDPSELLDIDDQITLDGELGGTTKKTFRQKKEVLVPISKDADAFQLGRPSPPIDFGKKDPIADQPSKVWYFRTRGFGERGPLKSKMMQKHLAAGDVDVGSMVWREDWDDWVAAELAFPELAKKAKSSKQKARLARAIAESDYKIPESLDPNSEFNQLRRKRNRIFIAATVSGLVIVACLVAILIKVVGN